MARFGSGWWLDGRFSPALTAPGIGGGGLPNTMVVELASGYLYTRSAWDATWDVVQAHIVSDVPGSLTANQFVAPTGIRKIPIATSRTGMAAAYNASLDWLASQPDDGPPMKYNNTFIGGFHGASIVKSVTATAHGKAVGDIGSQWTSPGGVNFWLIAIPDANTLWFLSGNTSGNADRWTFNTTLAASGTMTYVTGGVNTSNISYSAQATAQLRPCLQDYSRAVKLNGTTPISVDGVYDCNHVTIVESYGIASPVSALAYVIAGRPWATAPALNHTSIDTQVLCEYTYDIHDNGSTSVLGRFENLTTLNLNTNTGYAGFVQAGPINWVVPAGAESLNLYAPRVNGIVGGVKTWNFEAGEAINGTFEALEFTSACWKEPTNPPNRTSLFVKTTATGVRSRGFALGYSLLSGAGASLSSYINNFLSISAARKQYPKVVTDQALGSTAGILPANTVVTATAYRIMYNLAATPEMTTNAVRLYEGGAEVMLDFHQNVTAYAVPVPAKLNGKTVTIVDGNGNLTLDSAVVTAGAITVSVTGSYGAAVLSVA